MNVVKGQPPNIDAIREAFGPLAATVVFAYGDTIYAPGSRGQLPFELLVHEGVHARQQSAVGGPEAWWARYIADAKFRLEQEVEAYTAQISSHPFRAGRRECLHRVATDLARLYRLPINRADALRILKGAV